MANAAVQYGNNWKVEDDEVIGPIKAIEQDEYVMKVEEARRNRKRRRRKDRKLSNAETERDPECNRSQGGLEGGIQEIKESNEERRVTVYHIYV